MIARLYHIRGVVQGVGFRSFVYYRAKALGVKGYVQNEDDGSVTVEAESEENTLFVFEKYLYEGPAFAQIEGIELEELPVQGFKDFEVR